MNKKKKKTMMTILYFLLFISCAFLIYSISLISGIENEIRYIGMGALFLINILIIVLAIHFTNKNKKISYIIFPIIIILFVVAQAVGGYYIFKIYNTISNINKDTVKYETAVVVMKDSTIGKIEDLANKKVGIVEDETSISDYIIGLEIIEENKLNDISTVVEYTDKSSLVSDLYNNKIDAMIIASNYTTMFTSVDEYKNIKDDTKVISTKSRTLTKEEASKYTGDESLNLNSSGFITEPFTVLLMGVDSTDEVLDPNASANGDTLMIITFNPKTLNATVLSIPRDSYVPIACFAGQRENKITHSAWQGESCTIRTVQNLLTVNIDYYVKMNFKGIVKLVDALGGIEVDVPLDFCESDSNRETDADSRQCLSRGFQKINGEQALALARHRYLLERGDFDRVKNQQIVVQGVINSAKNIKSANQAMEMLNVVSSSMDTNFTTKQILSFYDILKNLLITSSTNSIINLQQLELTGSSQMIYDEGTGLVLYNFIINQSSLNQVITAMKQNLGAQSVSGAKQMDFDIEDTFEMSSIGTDVTSGTKLYSLLDNYVGSNASAACGAMQAKGIKCNIEYTEVTEGTDGIITTQNLPANKRIDKIDANGITFTATKLVEKPDEDDGEVNPEEPGEVLPEGTTTP